MNSGPFWLVNISNETLSVSLVTFEQNYHVSSIGPDVTYESDTDSFIRAVDMSLSSAAESVSLSPDQEPDTVALIIPPSWIGNDGKIVTEKLRQFEALFKELKLRPMGFIGQDDAIAEANNQTEGYLSSFVLVHFQPNSITVSLIYLGKVIERNEREITSGFSSEVLESILLDLKSDSTLPPQIIVTGTFADTDVTNIKSHSWVGRKDIETFLHFPDIKSYDKSELISVLLRAVASQFDTPSLSATTMNNNNEEVGAPEEIDSIDEIAEVDMSDSFNEDTLEEVDPEDIGFGPVDSNFVYPQESKVEDVPVDNNITIPQVTPPPKIKFSAPKIKFSFPSLPKFKIGVIFIPFVISPLFLLIPFYYSKAEITLFLSPYNFQKTLNATFDPSATEINLSKGVFPVTTQQKELPGSASVSTTGQKTVGERAEGEVTIYNKLDKPLSLSKGQILVDEAGRKFELTTSVQVVPSASNLSLGVITLGQTKAIVKAADIGSEYNLEKDVVLKIKDVPESSAITKVNSTLTGGNKRQIKAVSAADKAQLETKLIAVIESTTNSYLQEPASKNPDMIPELTQTKKGRVEYNREVGEEADELTATVTITVTTYSLNTSQKNKIVKALFSNDADFANVVPDFEQFSISIPVKDQITVAAKYLPKIDKQSIARLAAGKSQNRAFSDIQKNNRRVYNYQIVTNFKPITFINPLPFRPENIVINIK